MARTSKVKQPLLETVSPVGTPRLLPSFALYILEHRLLDYIKEQLALARKLDIPMLRDILKLTDEQLIEHSVSDNKEFLQCLVQDKYSEYMRESNNRWLQDRLGYTGKYDVVTADITRGGTLRNRALKQFIPDFVPDIRT